jgi:hypothetical protein
MFPLIFLGWKLEGTTKICFQMKVPDLFSSWSNSWWRFLICLTPEVNAYYWFTSWISLIIFSSFQMLESLSWIPNCRYHYDSKSGLIHNGSFHLLCVYFTDGQSRFGVSTTAHENHDELLETNCCCFPHCQFACVTGPP